MYPTPDQIMHASAAQLRIWLTTLPRPNNTRQQHALDHITECTTTHTTRAFKLFRLRRDGSIGPLFINARQRVPVGAWMPAEYHHRNAGFKYRAGWHCTSRPHAPHLSPKGRVWMEVEIGTHEVIKRPASQGGVWYLAESMRVIGPAVAE